MSTYAELKGYKDFLKILESLVSGPPPEEVPRQFEGHPPYTGAPDYPIQPDPFIDPQLLGGLIKGLIKGAALAVPVALSKSGWEDAIEKILKFVPYVRNFSKKEAEEIAKVALRIPRKARKSIDIIGTFKDIGEEKFPKSDPLSIIHGAIWSKLHPIAKEKGVFKTKIGIEPTKLAPITIPHEVGHELYYLMFSKKDKDLLKKVFEDYINDPKKVKTIEKIEKLINYTFSDELELFAEAYAQYLAGSKTFHEFPVFVRHLVKKYHKLAK